MKKTFLALVFATVFTACNSGAKVEGSTVDSTAVSVDTIKVDSSSVESTVTVTPTESVSATK